MGGKRGFDILLVTVKEVAVVEVEGRAEGTLGP